MSSKSEIKGYGYCNFCGKKYNYKENYMLGEELDLHQGDRISVISGGGVNLGHGVFIRISNGFLIWVRDAGNHLTITSLKGIDIEKITS